MQFYSIIIILSLFGEVQPPKSSIGVSGGALVQIFRDTSETWPVIGSVMEITMPGFLSSFAIRGTARLSWYKKLGGGLCLRNITVILASKYTKRFYDSRIGIYGGGGPGVHLYSWSKKEECNREDNWVGFHFFTGIEYFFVTPKPWCCFAELDWGKEIGEGEGFPGFGEVSQLGLTAGARF